MKLKKWKDINKMNLVAIWVGVSIASCLMGSLYNNRIIMLIGAFLFIPLAVGGIFISLKEIIVDIFFEEDKDKKE